MSQTLKNGRPNTQLKWLKKKPIELIRLSVLWIVYFLCSDGNVASEILFEIATAYNSVCKDCNAFYLKLCLEQFWDHQICGDLPKENLRILTMGKL